MMSKKFACFGFLVLSLNAVLAQSVFEVASIKPSDPNTYGTFFRNGPGEFYVRGATLKLLIQQAYDVREFQISGGPGWISSDRYDVAAKSEPGASPPSEPRNFTDQRNAMEQQRERLRALLADRFRLKIRRETKELQAYVLTTAKGGPKLKESNLGDQTPAPNGDKGRQSPRGANLRVARGQIMGQSVPLDFLAQALSQQLGRTVLDKTGLKGAYDFTLEWTADPAQGLGPGLGPGEPSAGNEPTRSDSAAPAETSGPTLFAALQEQLGLRLESQKATVEILVIESVEKPSEN